MILLFIIVCLTQFSHDLLVVLFDVVSLSDDSILLIVFCKNISIIFLIV